MNAEQHQVVAIADPSGYEAACMLVTSIRSPT